MGKELSTKLTSSLSLLNVCGCSSDLHLKWCVNFFFGLLFLKEGIRSYFGTPTWQTIGVFLAGVLTTVLVIRKM